MRSLFTQSRLRKKGLKSCEFWEGLALNKTSEGHRPELQNPLLKQSKGVFFTIVTSSTPLTVQCIMTMTYSMTLLKSPLPPTTDARSPQTALDQVRTGEKPHTHTHTQDTHTGHTHTGHTPCNTHTHTGEKPHTPCKHVTHTTYWIYTQDTHTHRTHTGHTPHTLTHTMYTHHIH